MRTRSSKLPAAPPTGSDKPTTKATPTHQPAPVPGKALKTLILPSKASDNARFVTLDNPATGRPSPYYFCPSLGLYEFTLIGPPAKAAKSILFTPCAGDTSQDEAYNDGNEKNGTEKVEEGYISRLAQLHVATPVDVLFFLLPIVAPAVKRGQAQRLFQPLDDILDAQEESDVSRTLRSILLHCAFRQVVERRMTAVCDTVEAGETMFRISGEKLVKELFSKAERMAERGLPASMEERFVRRELELPVLSVRREYNTNKSESATETEANTESQESSTSITTIPLADTPITPADTQTEAAVGNRDGDGDDTMRHLLRLRTSLSFIISSYLPPHLRSQVETSLKSPQSPQDFTPLTTHLKHIATLRARAQESRALYSMSRKRGIEEAEDGGAGGSRAEKKRKEEEEEKRKKAGESRGVRDLKKVNTSGMMKLSAFFGKATKK